MNGISVNIVVLLLRGVPEGMLAVLALHFFTRTKVDIKKYLLLCLIYVSATYFIRFLPITLGVNSVLSLFVLIISFQFTYKGQLSKVIRSIISAAVILTLVAISEVLNMVLLIMIYGRTQAEILFTSDNGLTETIYTYPSVIFFAIFIFIGRWILKKYDLRKKKNGETSEKTGE